MRLKQYDAKFPYETLSEPLNESVLCAASAVAPLLAPFSQASFVLIRAHHARARQVCESRTTTPSSPTPLHSVSAFAGLSLEMQKASVDGSINKCDADPRRDDGRCADDV